MKTTSMWTSTSSSLTTCCRSLRRRREATTAYTTFPDIIRTHQPKTQHIFIHRYWQNTKYEK